MTLNSHSLIAATLEAKPKTDWAEVRPELLQASLETIQMVAITMVIAGIGGFLIGLLLYTTRRGNILQNRPLNFVLNLVVNFVRPIPFIILLVALGPVMLATIGTTIEMKAAVFGMVVAAVFAVARIVEQNLVSIDPGVIEAARAMGASKARIMFSVILPEALGPLVLGYTFLLIGVVDMSAMAGYIGAGGLGDYALSKGYQRFNWDITMASVLIIIVMVQFVQLFGNWLARKIMRR